MNSLMIRLSLLLLLTAGFAHADEQQVVATNRPLHSIVSTVMDDVGEPLLLLNQSDSPHHQALKPSKAKELQHADLLFWYGPAMSAHLQHSIESLMSEGTAINVLEAPGVNPLTYTGNEAEDITLADPHVWLDPIRVSTIALYVADELAALDPENAERYVVNASEWATELKELHERFSSELATAADQPMLIMHDAYQYFAERYSLSELHPVLIDIDSAPSAKQIRQVNTLIKSLDIKCMLVEPQFSQNIVSALNQDLAIVSIDPIGFEFDAGPAQYKEMMDALVSGVAECANQ